MFEKIFVFFNMFIGFQIIIICLKNLNSFRRDSIHGRQVGFAVLAVAAKLSL